MRVLLNTRVLLCTPRTGIGYYVDSLYRALLREGFDVIPTVDIRSTSLVTSAGRVSSRLRRVLGNFYPSSAKILGDAVYRHFHTKDTAATGYDLYHETTFDPLPDVPTRTVCNVYDLSFLRFPDFFLKDFYENVKPNLIRNASSAERVMVNTRFIKEEVQDILKVPGERIDIIPLAASTIYGKGKNPSSRQKVVRKYTEKEYILYVGTVEPRKNLKTLIRAYREVRSKYDVALVIAGGFGWLYDDIVSYPEKLGIGKEVIFTNYVDEETLRDLYQSASVFIYPSLYEGFGIPPLEAMACGTPVIVSDIPPHREVSGDAALYFDPSDHEALAGLIARVLSSAPLAAEMKQKGLIKAGEYSWQRVATETIRTYEKAIVK